MPDTIQPRLGLGAVPDSSRISPAMVRVADGDHLIAQIPAKFFRDDPKAIVEEFNRAVAARAIAS